MKLNVVSLEICPFTQRSVIALLEKGMKYDITYLTMPELKNPPQWFKDISPFGKVPILRAGEVTVFESSVIMEYIDEINPPSLHPAAPLQRALNRAWMKFGEELLGSLFGYTTASDEAAMTQCQQKINDGLNRLEALITDGPFFNGPEFCMIDASYAPLFVRLEILEKRRHADFYENKPKVARWAEACLKKDSVQNSIVPDLEGKYIKFISNISDYAAQVFGSTSETAS